MRWWRIKVVYYDVLIDIRKNFVKLIFFKDWLFIFIYIKNIDKWIFFMVLIDCSFDLFWYIINYFYCNFLFEVYWIEFWKNFEVKYDEGSKRVSEGWRVRGRKEEYNKGLWLIRFCWVENVDYFFKIFLFCWKDNCDNYGCVFLGCMVF